MKIGNGNLKMGSYFNCSSLLRREAGREGAGRAGEGFTLAEVLIALAVIGVIAAVTVPVLMQNTNKQEYVTALQKTYSTLSQVTNQIIAEEGSPKGDEGGWAKDVQAVYEIYKKHLNNAKECEAGAGCFTQGKYRYLNNNLNHDNWDVNSNYRHLILADGVQLLFFGTNTACRGSSWGADNDGCSFIGVDVNGAKMPNIFGRDVFAFILKEQGLYPAGCDSTLENCAGTGGHGCACKVLREGAMNY